MRFQYSTMLAIFSVIFIAAIIAFARSVGNAEELHTRFFVSTTGPLIQSGNCIVHAGEASMAIAATNAVVRILKLPSIF
jgi:hypothetical protein